MCKSSMTLSSPRSAAVLSVLCLMNESPSPLNNPDKPTNFTARWCPRGRRWSRRRPGQGPGHQSLRLLLNPPQVVRAAEALGVQLVDVLGPGRTHGKPCVRRDYLDASKRVPVARSRREDLADLLAGEVGDADVVGRQLLQHGSLRRGEGRLDPFVHRVSQVARELAIDLARVPAAPRRDLGG